MIYPDLNIGLGTVLQVEFIVPGIKKEPKGYCIFVGVYVKDYIILSLPEFKQIVEMSEILQPKRLVRIRYLYEGDIYVFSSSIESVMMSGHQLLFVKYPTSIQVKKLRKYPRAHCKLKGELNFLDDDVFKGTIDNISTGGVRFVVAFDKKPVDYIKGVKEEVKAILDMDEDYRKMKLNIKFPGVKDFKQFSVLIRNFEVRGKKVILGYQFIDTNIEQQHLISQYLEAVAV